MVSLGCQPLVTLFDASYVKVFAVTNNSRLALKAKPGHWILPWATCYLMRLLEGCHSTFGATMEAHTH